MRVTRKDVLFYLGLLCAVWFALTGMAWTYNAALLIAYPIGLLSFALWWAIRREARKRTKAIPIILGIGLTLSLSVLITLLITN